MITRESIAANKNAYLMAIGQVALSWSQLEPTVEFATWIVADIDPQLGRAFTNEAGMVSLLITLQTLVHTKVGESGKHESIKTLAARINRLRTKRNNILHSLWGFSGDAGAFAMKAGAKGKLTFETSHEYQTVSDVETVNKQIIAATRGLEEWIRAWQSP